MNKHPKNNFWLIFPKDLERRSYKKKVKVYHQPWKWQKKSTVYMDVVFSSSYGNPLLIIHLFFDYITIKSLLTVNVILIEGVTTPNCAGFILSGFPCKKFPWLISQLHFLFL